MLLHVYFYHLGSVKVRMLALSAECHGFDLWPGQTSDIKNGIYCLSTKHAALRSKSKDCLAQSQNNVSGNKMTHLPGDCCFLELAC